MSWFEGAEHEPFQFGDGDHAVLLIHGFMGTPAEMRPFGHALADAGFTAAGMLQPGFGPDIAWLASLTAEQWIEAALAAFDRLAAEHEWTSIVGYSMGAPVALQVAAARRVERLVLIAPLWKLLGGDPKLKLLPLVRRLVKRVQPFKPDDLADPDVQNYIASSFPEVDLSEPRNREFIAEQMTLPTATIDEVRKLAARAPQCIREIVATPTLVIQGISDQSVRAAHTRRLLQEFSGPLTYIQIPGDHLLTMDGKETWAVVRDQVLSFLGGDREQST
ncbi:MAG: alpha/beta hydrolase [Chloroflexota bacterium]